MGKNYQFNTNIKLSDAQIEEVAEIKLLRTIITNDRKWNRNTEELVRKANMRMQILHKISKFNPKKEYMINIYNLCIRSILEQACPVWNSSLSEENKEDLERVQKCAMKIIHPYLTYEESLFQSDLEKNE